MGTSNRPGVETYQFHGVYMTEDLQPTAILYLLDLKKAPKQISIGTETLVYSRLDAGPPHRLRLTQEFHHVSRLPIDLRALNIPLKHTLLVDAETAKVPGSRKGVQTGSYIDAARNEVLIVSYGINFNFSYYDVDQMIGPKIDLDDDWRQRQSDELKFLAFGIMYVHNRRNQIRHICALRIKTNQNGISHRVASMCLCRNDWDSAKAKRRRVSLT
jgi:hypothetical protein